MVSMSKIDFERTLANRLLDRAREPSLTDSERRQRRELYDSQVERVGLLLAKYHAAVDRAAREAAQRVMEGLR